MAKRYCIISDLHLGDGSRADTFALSKSGPLLAELIHTVATDPDGHLVMLGDILELWQFSFEQVLVHHAELLDALFSLAGSGRITWVIGNHEYEPVSRYLPFGRIFGSVPVATELVLPELGLYMAHGHMQDPHIERLIPVKGEEYVYTFSRALVYYLKYLVRLSPHADDLLRLIATAVQNEIDEASALGRSLKAMTPEQRKAALLEIAKRLAGYRTVAETGPAGEADPWEQAAFDLMQSKGYRYVVFGHTHVPAVVAREGRTYLNAGSWCSADQYPPTLIRADTEQGTVTLWSAHASPKGIEFSAYEP